MEFVIFIVFVCIYLVITNNFGFFGFLFIVGVAYFWFQHTAKQETKRLAEQKRIEEEKRKLEPCKHGTVSAKLNFKLCTKCVADYEAAKRQQEEKKRQEELKKLQIEQEYRRNICNRDYLKQTDAVEFERIIHALYRAMGYQVQETPVTNDGGVDGFATKGNIKIVLQCKRYAKARISRPAMQQFYGVVIGCKKDFPDFQVEGHFFTTSSFANTVKEYVAEHNKPIKLFDINETLKLIDRYLGINNIVPENYVTANMSRVVIRTAEDERFEQQIREIVRRDSRSRGACPKCGNGYLVRKTGRYGAFYGCTNYPRCRYTQNT